MDKNFLIKSSLKQTLSIPPQQYWLPLDNHIENILYSIAYNSDSLELKEYLDNYVNQLNAVIDEPNLLREKFYELFKQLFIDINLVAPVKECN